MKKNKFYLISIAFFFLIVLGALYFFNFHQKDYLPTYFSYSPTALNQLNELTSQLEVTKKELEDWDDETFALIKKYKLEDRYAARIFSYLYTAQADFAFLSYNLKGKMLGSITPISAEVLGLLFPNEIKSISDFNQSGSQVFDEYTSNLTNLVFEKIKERFKADKKQEKLFPEKISPHFWAGRRPYSGQDTGSWKTWNLEKGDQFRSPPPPEPDSQEWKKQLELTKDALKNITPEQKIAVVHWAGGPGTMTPPGLWLVIASEYIDSKTLPLRKILEVRAVLARAVADAAIAVFDSKYTYWIKRPNMMDPSVQTVMPTPNYPSYPAGHSAISAAAATILTFYFPEMKEQWDKNQEEASNTRIWGGIHFLLDAKEGIEQGKKVAEEALKKEAERASHNSFSPEDIQTTQQNTNEKPSN